jgi:hypothetical protein
MTMQAILKDRLFLLLGILLGITLLSWVLSHTLALESQMLGIALILLAFLKVRLIIVHYMETKIAIPAIKIAFDVWVFVVAAITLWLYLL